MQRWKSWTYKGNQKCESYLVFMTLKECNSEDFSLASLKARLAQVSFAEKLRMILKSLKKQKHGYLIHT